MPNIIQQIMAKGKNGNEEATKIHLVDDSPNYGAAGQSDHLKKDPFGENYQEDTTFWEKVYLVYYFDKVCYFIFSVSRT